MSQRADQLAARLTERCRSFDNITRFMDIDYATVKSALKPNEVLLDFTDYVSETMGRKYAAYIGDVYKRQIIIRTMPQRY